MDRGVGMGPLNNRAGLKRVAGQVDAARERDEGEIVAGGRVPEGEQYKRGLFFLPTLITGVPHDSILFSEETFGPVLPIATVSGLDEALTLANNSRYGLGASVWTRSADAIARATEELEAGIVWVNQHLRIPPEVPFGGRRRAASARRTAAGRSRSIRRREPCWCGCRLPASGKSCLSSGDAEYGEPSRAAGLEVSCAP